MEVIKKLGTELINNHWYGMALFRCPKCGEIVKKKIWDGMRYKTCGCGRSSHGDARKNYKERLYATWISMLQRCNNVNNSDYKDYGGRGITVCKEWQCDYLAFKSWSLSSGYSKNLTIDRVNNDLRYSPDNCRWATRATQARNKSTTKLTWNKVNLIRAIKIETDIDSRHIAKIFNVSQSHICNILNNKKWVDENLDK